MIKKFKIILISTLFLSFEGNALTPDLEREIFVGCYGNSKMYLGSKKAKKYCQCTIKKLDERYSNNEVILIFKKKPEEIVKATEYASNYCAKNT